jgi:predicted nucleotide-binding protein (sugar kinase/HSP70/actin superfamily)
MQELQGRTLFIPEMDYGGARVLAAAFRREGIKATVVPPSNGFSNILGGKFTSGDECYPTKVTLGDFLAILERGDVKPNEAAFFMATADGPCRFGQYHQFMKKTLEDMGHKDIPIFSLTSSNSYEGFGNEFVRIVWQGIVATDILRKFLLMTRPYEKNKGDSDVIYQDGVEDVCKLLEEKTDRQSKKLISILKRSRDLFNKIPTVNKGSYPLIGVLGEIFCRLNAFSNQDIIRRLEEHGAECWLVGVAEWILYTNADEIRRLKEKGKRFSKAFLKTVIKRWILMKDEHDLYNHFRDDFKGREECNVNDLLKMSLPYLPWYGSLGEMTLSAAGAIYFHKKGCVGVVDISSFACMNEIVAEAIFPKISKDLNGFPIKVFYFDGTTQNLSRDIEIFLELARNYKRKK